MVAQAAGAALSLVLIGFVWPSATRGDEVITTTGDRLTGTIIDADSASVFLKTPYAGIIKIDRAQVRSLQTGSEPTTPVALAYSAAPTMAALDGAQPNAQGTPAASSGAETPERIRAGSSRPSPFTPTGSLSGRVNVALSQDKGNTDKDEIDVDYSVEYRRGWHRLRSFGALEFDTNNDEKTTDKWATFNQYSRLFPSRWYGAAWFALEHDRFADVRLRTLGGPALGYLAFEGEALNLAVQAGPTVLREDFYGQPDQDFFGAGWSLNYDQLVWRDRLQPYHRQVGYVALDGEDKSLWQAWTGLRVPLAGGFTGAVEFEFDYDSKPAVEAKTTDTTLRLKLGYEW